MDSPDSDEFELSDLLGFSNRVEEHPQPVVSGYPQNHVHVPNYADHAGGSSSSHHVGLGPARGQNGGSQEARRLKERVAFRTETEIEVLDDGFKWRKYGKKKVKNSPNPRNYYKCSVKGCPVKKRVERDRENNRVVITTYEGVHIHEGPTKS